MNDNQIMELYRIRIRELELEVARLNKYIEAANETHLNISKDNLRLKGAIIDGGKL